MGIQSKVAGICIALGAAQLAIAETPPTGSAESDLRRIVVESTADGRASIGAQTRHYVRATPVSDELLDKCAMTDFQYWQIAGRRIAEGSRQKGRRLASEVGYVDASSRDDLLKLREALLDGTEPHFLDAGDRLEATPAGYAQDLRQRAEWSALLDQLVDEIEDAYLADSNEASALFALASWERTRCNFAKRNARVLDSALSELDPVTGASEAAKWTPTTYRAMAAIGLSSNDAQLAARLVALPADRFDDETLAALRAIAAS